MLWGLTLHPGQPCTRELKEVIHLSLATLESRAELGKDQSYSQVVVATEDSEQLLCTLVHGMVFQQCLDLKLMPQEKVTFTVQGSSTVFITGYTGRVPERQQDEDERMEEMGEQGSPNITRTGHSEAGAKETGDDLMMYQEVGMEVGVASEDRVRQSHTGLVSETQNFSAESEILIKREVEERGFDEIDTSADEHQRGKSELQRYEHHHGDDREEDLHGDDGFLPVVDAAQLGDKETCKGQLSSVSANYRGDATTGNQVSSGLDGQGATVVQACESTRAMAQQQGKSFHTSQVPRNRWYSGRRCVLRKRIARHRLAGKRPGYADIVSRKRMKSGACAKSSSDDHSTVSSVYEHTSPEDFPIVPPPQKELQPHHSETITMSQPASPSLPEVPDLDNRPLSAPSFTSQDQYDVSLPPPPMPGNSSSPKSTAIIPPPEKALPQLDHPESVSSMGSPYEPWPTALPEIQLSASQPLTEPHLMNQDMSADSVVYLPSSSMPHMSSSGSMYHPLHHETSTPVIPVLPVALKGLPLEAALYVSQLEHRIRALESKQETQVQKGKSPSYTEENGYATIGQEGGPTVKLDVGKYTSAWAKSTSGKDLVVKLMPLVFSDEMLASSNYHGGQVFSGQGWVRKNQLRDHPSFVAIVEQARIEYPGCFNSVEQYKELRDAVNAKCRKARIIR